MKKFVVRGATRIGRFFWSWRFLKIVLWSVTLIVLFYAEEDWRGARAWAATKAKWETRGESFDPNTYFPRPVPDDQNLAALPIFKMEPDPKNGGLLAPLKLQHALNENFHGGELPPLHRGKPDAPFDLDPIRMGIAKAYARAFPGAKPPADPLAQFDALYPMLSEIRKAAATRPYCRFNQDYTAQPPMYRGFVLLTTQINLSRQFALHAMIALEENKSDVALDDIKVNLRLAGAAARDPTVVGGLIAVGIIAITRGAIDEGIFLHAWNDSALVDLQAKLTRTDLLARYPFALRGEIITETIPELDYLKLQRPSFFGVWPIGLMDVDKSHMVDFFFRESRVMDSKKSRVYPEITRKLEMEVEKTEALPWRLAPWNIFFATAVGPISNLSFQFAEIQVHVDEDRIACALERYHLVHGAYPDSLDALAPAYSAELPRDVMNGEPYHYRLRPDGTFLLYSVGWNQKDDGGRVTYSTENPERPNFWEGDWPWPDSPWATTARR
jgi:hypothetical protein